MGNSVSKYNNLNCNKANLENILIYGEYNNSNTYHPYYFTEYKKNPIQNISKSDIIIKKKDSENYWESDYY